MNGTAWILGGGYPWRSADPDAELHGWTSSPVVVNPSLGLSLAALPGGPLGLRSPDDSLGRLTLPRGIAVDGRTVLVKHYAPLRQDGRDRYATERAFYRYMLAARVTGTTSPLGWNDAERVGVFSWNGGRAPELVEARHLAAALRFVADLNQARNKPEAQALAPASEACFSLADHAASSARNARCLSQVRAASTRKNTTTSALARPTRKSRKSCS